MISIITSLLIMPDALIAGIFLGMDAVAGVNLITPVYSFASFCGRMFSLGVSILYSKAMGRFDKEEADRYFGLGITVTTVIGLFLVHQQSFT